jgi:hypothetical protein
VKSNNLLARRNLLGGMLAIPAIVSFSSLMKVSSNKPQLSGNGLYPYQQKLVDHFAKELNEEDITYKLWRGNILPIYLGGPEALSMQRKLQGISMYGSALDVIRKGFPNGR